MSTTPRLFALLRLAAVVTVTTTVACASPAETPDVVVADASQDTATPDAPAPDAPADVVEGCIDATGAWESASACMMDSRLAFPTQACITQTACNAITGVGGDRNVMAGNVLTSTYSSNGIAGTCTYTFTGDTARADCTFTLPLRVSCSRSLRRVTAPGATRYCCDPAGTDCGSGQRCSPVSVGTSGGVVTACIPAGATANGATCTQTMSRVGSDTCAAGQTCVDYSPRPMNERTCQKLCTGPSQCGAGEGCRALPTTPPSGFCAPHCTVLGTECSAASTCRPLLFVPPMPGVPRIETGCERTGSLAEGAPCTTSDECGANMMCALQRGGMTACRRVCDSRHACPTGFSCTGAFDCPVGHNCAFYSEDPTAIPMNADELGACLQN